MKSRKTWILFVCLLLMPLCGCGERPQSGVEKPVEELKTEPAGPYIERLVETEKCFDVAGFEAYVFRFSGGLVECWVEVETDGKKEKVFGGLAEPQKTLASLIEMANISRGEQDKRERTFTEKDYSGYIIFLRPSSAKSAYAAQPRWNLEYYLMIGSPSGRCYSFYDDNLLVDVLPGVGGTRASRGPAINSEYLEQHLRQGIEGEHLQQGKEKLLMGWKWKEPREGGGERKRAMLLKCKHVAPDVPSQAP